MVISCVSYIDVLRVHIIEHNHRTIVANIKFVLDKPLSGVSSMYPYSRKCMVKSSCDNILALCIYMSYAYSCLFRTICLLCTVYNIAVCVMSNQCCGFGRHSYRLVCPE